MKFDVVLTDEAADNARSAIIWYSQQSPAAAAKWYDCLLEELAALSTNAERHSLARENSCVPIELRERIFGSGRRTTHRILFTIRPHNKVVIYAVRHVAQQDWRPQQSSD